MTVPHLASPLFEGSPIVACGQVLSVNVGRPISRQWRGTTVSSAIVKRPVDVLVAVTGVNLAGDAQADLAVHGGPRKAVYAYPSEHYCWWRREFAIEPSGEAPRVATSAEPQQVIFDRCSRVVLWSEPVMSLLDLAAKHGIAIPYSCRSGSCGTCAVRVLFGSVGYLRKPSAPVAAESCLTCTAYPLESTVLDA